MNCIICEKKIEKSSYTNAILCSSECFYFHFWNEKVEAKNNPMIARINGKQYHISDENSKSFFRGFGGLKLKIRFFDGREIVTTNLWHNGVISESHKKLLPDNAEFIYDEQKIQSVVLGG